MQGHFGNRLEGLPPLALLDSSEKALAMLLELPGDTYTYRISYTQPLAFSSGYDDITVRAGIPAHREMYSSRRDGTPGSGRLTVETQADLAALPEHDRPRTLPQLYEECRELLTRDPASGTPSFSYDGNYILMRCEYNDPAVADGMPNVSIQMRNWAWK